jgi:signal transduction histidine kinase/PAS domain-containing protein
MSSLQSGGISREEVASYSIRANHELILDLCRAKDALEQVNDRLPDLFGICTAEGIIVKANTAYSKLVQIDHEDIAYSSMDKLFRSETYRIIHESIKYMIKNNLNDFSLELPIDKQNFDKLFHWTFSRFDSVSDRRGQLLSFVGKDITRLRDLEGKLANIFTAIPLGVVTINSEKKIEWPYSAYTELLVKRKDLNGLTIEDGLFGNSLRYMNHTQKDSVQILLNQMGGEEQWFDMTKDQFPLEIPVGESTDIDPTGWIGLSYSPIIRQGIVDKVLVVVEDITERVRQRLSMYKKLTREQKLAQIFFDLQDAESFVLDSGLDDINSYIHKLGLGLKDGIKPRAFCTALHGIKGVARAVNFSLFKDFVHEMEARTLRNDAENEGNMPARLNAEFTILTAEWNELLKFITIFRSSNSEQKSIESSQNRQYVDLMAKKDVIKAALEGTLRSLPKELHSLLLEPLAKLETLTCAPLDVLTPKLTVFAQNMAEKLGKRVRLVCNWNESEVDQDKLAVISEIFYHLLTNAIDHGVEKPDERQSKGKPEEGLIKVTCVEDNKTLQISIEDDGAGINTDAVLAKAAKQGIVKPGESLSDNQIWNLVISSGFSTASVVTDFSGRGIGLDAVDERVKNLGGSGLMISRSARNAGTTFQFEMKKFR